MENQTLHRASSLKRSAQGCREHTSEALLPLPWNLTDLSLAFIFLSQRFFDGIMPISGSPSLLKWDWKKKKNYSKKCAKKLRFQGPTQEFI